MPNLYFCCYHSQPGRHLRAGALDLFRAVEEVIQKRVWPYDNGDDPSFYVSGHYQAPLTWGVCRRIVRQKIDRGDVVAFFAFRLNDTTNKVEYLLTAVATVALKISHSESYECGVLAGRPYLNRLITTDDKGKLVNAENDRPNSARHKDWQNRIAGKSYIIFSKCTTKTYITRTPVHVASAVPNQTKPIRRGFEEKWEPGLKKIVFTCLPQRRTNLRTTTAYGNQHPHIRFALPKDELERWRTRLIEYLRGNDE